MLVGYARVSTLDQKPALQIDALQSTGCERIFTEHASGAQRDRPELHAALDYLRAGIRWWSGSSIAWHAPCAN